jgi:hypothetical protein
VSDSVTFRLPGRTVHAIGIDVRPARLAPSMIAAMLWVDTQSHDVVRLQGTFLGDFLWDAPDSGATARDSAQARKDNRRAQGFVTVQADLEYALHEGRFWMPHRQTLTIMVEVDLLIRGAMPVRALTRFTDYEINADRPISFTPVADSLLNDEGRTICEGEDGSRRRRRRIRPETSCVRTGIWADGRWGCGSRRRIRWPPPHGPSR